MSRITRRAVVGSAAAFAFAPSIVSAQKKYDPGVTDKEIKLGHTNPYSGPLSAYGVIGKGITAYWQMVNDKGGINGRKVNFITYDDGFLPPKTVEMVRKLVEEDQVFAIYQLLGTPTNTVVQKYLNQKKVPQLFVATGASKWGNHKEFPWTMGWQPDYATEAAIYAKHIMRTMPNAKVAMLYQNDNSGKDYLNGFIAGFGRAKDKYLIKTASYEVSDPTVDSQIIQLKNSGANVLFTDAAPKAAAQSIRKVADLGWKPTRTTSPTSRPRLPRPEAGRPRQQQGHHHRGLPQGSDRPAMGQRAGLPRMEGVDGEVHPAGQHVGRLLHLCLRRVVHDAPRADPVRRQPHARQPDEAGGQHEEAGGADPAARHQHQHQPDRLLSDPVGAARPLRRRDLEAVRRCAEQREQLTSQLSSRGLRPRIFSDQEESRCARDDTERATLCAAMMD